jgi:CRISPR/Cas system-associated exonuclease Cas4 (RecB family)
MRTIRASEIGTYLYCKRAWWYHTHGEISENQIELAQGTAFHQSHGRKVVVSGLMRLAAWIILLVAVAIFAIAIARLIIH